MKFDLNEYHRNTLDQEFIEDVIKVTNKLNKSTLTTDEYTANGKYHHSTLIRRFGSWKKVLQVCSLTTEGHNFKCTFTDEDVITDLCYVANKLKQDTLTKEEYDKYGKYSGSTLSKKYDGWNTVLKLAGLKLNVNRNITDDEMFNEIERVWILLGHQPTTNDMKKGISNISLQSFSRRFGGWRGALQAFVSYINNDLDSSTSEEIATSKNATENQPTQIQHKTNRDINLRLRFKVMQRDNFKCCACGASPAKDPSVELHIDHVIPWSKGGETVLDNLQTLCSKCNLGKSDLI